MVILGISAFYHDSAATLLMNGDIIAAAQEERFTRKKHDPAFPVNAVRYCLDEAGLTLDQLDAVVFYDKPLLKFERLLETYYAFAPDGLSSFIKSMPLWIKEKIFLKKLIRDELAKVEKFNKRELKLLFPEHHLSHAASAFFASPFEDAAVLTLDGVGEWSTASIAHGQGNSIKVIKELRFPHSLGLLYSAFTYFLGFKVNSGEYKLMGLAPYGDPESEEVAAFVKLIKENLMVIYDDGSIWLDQKYFNYATGLRMVRDRKWQQLFGFPRRAAESELSQKHCNLALAIQQVTEEVVLKSAKEAKRLTGSENLCLAGGVALNCVANGKLQSAGIFKNIYVQPAAGDAGGSLGAALAAYYIHFQQERTIVSESDSMSGSYLGPEFSDREVQGLIARHQAQAKHFEAFHDLAQEAARHLAEGKVVGWFQGRMEFGPRALGNRSILGDPRNPEMQLKLNLKIKYRESFRPFAPSVLAADCNQYFECEHDSPYMLMVHPVREERRKKLPENYHQLPLKEKLYHERSDLPSITHIDYSARIQTVHEETNPRYHQLIAAFKEKTGCPMVINTSFNVRGEPIVCSPDDAWRCFMNTEMDVLVINDYLFLKSEQPNVQSASEESKTFALD